MRELTKAENLIKEAFLSDDADLKLAFKLLLGYYKIVDKIKHDNNCAKIILLYASPNRKLTKECVARETFTNVKSLKSCRLEYIECFSLFYKQVVEKKITEETAASLFLDP